MGRKLIDGGLEGKVVGNRERSDGDTDGNTVGDTVSSSVALQRSEANSSQVPSHESRSSTQDPLVSMNCSVQAGSTVELFFEP